MSIKFLSYSTVLFFLLLCWWMTSIENEFYVIQKENLETQKIELEQEEEKLKTELDEAVSQKQIKDDIEFSIKMSKMKSNIMEISPVEKQIRKISKEMNFNPETAVRIAMCESSLCPTAKNPTSSATGLFQFMTGTWNAYCAGDRLNVEDSTRCFIKLYPKYPYWWKCS